MILEVLAYCPALNPLSLPPKLPPRPPCHTKRAPRCRRSLTCPHSRTAPVCRRSSWTAFPSFRCRLGPRPQAVAQRRSSCLRPSPHPGDPLPLRMLKPPPRKPPAPPAAMLLAARLCGLLLRAHLRVPQALLRMPWTSAQRWAHGAQVRCFWAVFGAEEKNRMIGDGGDALHSAFPWACRMPRMTCDVCVFGVLQLSAHCLHMHEHQHSGSTFD